MRIWLLASLLLASPLAAKEGKHRETEFSIVRDLLQPVGMPVVSSFHAMRESLFFNAHDTQSGALESVGDFFLAPSRFLFGGKDITLVDPEHERCDVQPSFKYEKHLLLKTGLSLIAFPVTHTIGSLIKGIAYFSPTTRKKHAILDKALHFPVVKSNYFLYLQKGLKEFHVDQLIPCLHHKRPSKLSKKHRIEIKALKEVCQVLDENHILYWIDCGTCLGAYRYGGMIPWDVDIDLSILTPDHDNVKRLLGTLDPDKYEIQDWSSYSNPNTFLKLYIKKSKTQIDIYHYDLDEKARTATYFYTFRDTAIPDNWKKSELVMTKPVPYEAIFPLKKAEFDGLSVWAPNDVVAFLKSKYGENLEPTMIWDEATQSYQKVKDHPYWQDVE